jgi:hypothetical protein
MLDTTSYSERLPPSLNAVLKSFTGGECLRVKKVKDNKKLVNRALNCHQNVSDYVVKYGGSSVSGWLLDLNAKANDVGLFVWSFHSVWRTPDDKLIDVTDNKGYTNRDKTLFVPDSTRLPNLELGEFYNNFMVITDPRFAHHYSKSIGTLIVPNTPYWMSSEYVMKATEHTGLYRFISSKYPNNVKRLADDYGLEIVNGKLHPISGSIYETADGLPKKILFDYGFSSSQSPIK